MQRPSTSLFGAAPTTQPQQTTSLFGSTNTTQPQQSNSLFGNLQPQQQQPTTSLFGAQPSQNQPASTSLFGSQQPQQQQQPQTNTFLGMTATAPGANQPVSLLHASQHRQPQASFAGRLTLGQQPNAATNQPNPNASTTGTSAVKMDFSNMKSTTRFADCIPEVQAALERIDVMIRTQERFAQELEAFLPRHGQGIESIPPDVDLVSEKTDAAEIALALDAQGVETEKNVLHKDNEDRQRLEKVVESIRVGSHHIYNPRDEGGLMRELDLVEKFFTPRVEGMEKDLGVYGGALGEVEGHLGILEQSAVVSTGVGSKGSGFGSVKELAETLGAFEEGILGAAGMVGFCRENVNSLVLGRNGLAR
jgi:nucleoporin p58/p45